MCFFTLSFDTLSEPGRIKFNEKFLHELIRFSQATQVSHLNQQTFPPDRSNENFDLTCSSHFFNVFTLVVFAIFSTAHLTILSVFLCSIWPGAVPFKNTLFVHLKQTLYFTSFFNKSRRLLQILYSHFLFFNIEQTLISIQNIKKTFPF